MNVKKIAFILTIVALIVIPLIASRQLFSFFDLPKTIALYFVASLLLCCYAASDGLAGNSGMFGKYLIFYFGWLLFAALITSSLSLAFFGGYSRYEGCIFFIASGFFFFIGNWMKEYKRQLSLVLVITGAVVGALAVWEYWGGCRFYPQRVCSTFGNPMLLATYFVLITPVCLGMVWSESNRWLKMAGYVSLALLIMGNVFTFSRGGWGGFLLTGLVFLVFSFRNIRQRPTIILPLFILVVLSISASVLMIKYQPAQDTVKNPDRLNTIVKQPVNDPARLTLMKMAWEVFKENPLTGVGLNGFAKAATKHLPAKITREAPNLNFDMVHNDLLHTLATQGLLGLIVFLGFIGLLILYWKRWWTIPAKDPLDSGLWAAIIGYLILIQFSFPWVGYTFIFWLLIGLAVPQSTETSTVRKHYLARPIRLTIAAVLAVLAIGYGILAYRADALFCQGYLNRENLWKYKELLSRAVKLAPWETEYRFLRAYNAFAIAKEPKTTKKLHIQMSKVLTEEIFPLLEGQPNNYKYYLFLGDVFDFYGKADKAEEHYKKARELYPNFYPVYLSLGGLMARTNRYNEAKTYFKQALKIKPDYQEAREKLKQLRELQR
jgi:O-antigen ligase